MVFAVVICIIMVHPKSAHFQNYIDSTVAEWADDAE
jgi:hypothetical protein